MSKITVFRTSPYSIKKKSSKTSSQKNVSISAEELRTWISSGKIFSQLFRYKQSIMVTYDLRLISKPFLSSLLMRILARGESIKQDSKGVTQKITFRSLMSLLVKMLKDMSFKNTMINQMKMKISSAQTESNLPRKIDLSKPPVYLRTDFCFGLQSGGSVGHIAGVLNNLNQFAGNPIFLTSDIIPTVNPSWESHVIFPGDSFWDFSELPPLHYNHVFFKEALQIIKSRQPSFIYQRYSINNFVGIQIAQHYQVPFILEYNGSEVWVNRNWGGSSLKYEALAEQIEMLNLKACNLVVVISQPLKNELIAKGIDTDKILVNPNGVDPNKYSPEVDGNPIREKYQLQQKTVLGFIGTFGKWHGADILIEAFGKLLRAYPDFKNTLHLLMVGDGQTMPLVKEALFKWGISDYCTLTGTVPQELGPSHLAACDILVSPHVPNADGSAFFGSPTKLFEYMAMGKGIVASDLDQIGEVLKHNHSAWMVKPGDADSLMLGIKALIDYPLIRAQLGKVAREDAVSRHTWKEHTRKIIDKLCKL